MAETDAPEKRGFLRESDRAYLAGDREEPTRNAEYQRRYEIRERFKKALEDFRFLMQLGENDIDLLFEDAIRFYDQKPAAEQMDFDQRYLEFEISMQNTSQLSTDMWVMMTFFADVMGEQAFMKLVSLSLSEAHEITLRDFFMNEIFDWSKIDNEMQEALAEAFNLSNSAF